MFVRSFLVGRGPAYSGPQRWDFYIGSMCQPRERRGTGRCVQCMYALCSVEEGTVGVSSLSGISKSASSRRGLLCDKARTGTYSRLWNGTYWTVNNGLEQVEPVNVAQVHLTNDVKMKVEVVATGTCCFLLLTTKCSTCLLFTFSKPLWHKIRRRHRKESRIASFCSNCLRQVRFSSPWRLHANSATTYHVSS